MAGAPLVMRALADESAPKLGRGLVSAATGLGIGALVARTFVEMDLRDVPELLFPVGIGSLAAVCTGVGTLLALRAKTTAGGVLWTVGANVGPPSIVCLPTVLGLVFSLPAGLFAACLVLPAVLGTRAVTRADAPGTTERASLVAAAFLLVVGAVSTMIDCEWAPTAASWVLSLGPIALATGLAAYVAARSTVRLAATLAIESGRVPGHSLTRELGDRLRVTRAVHAGHGPHRTAPVHGAVAELHTPTARIAWAMLLLLSSVALAAARTAALCAG